MTTLKYSNVSFAYPNSSSVLHDINLELHSGEILGVIGPNGAGKSTLLKLANGLLKPQTGEVYINNENITKQKTSDIAQDLVLTFQFSRQQFFTSSVEEELIVTLNIHVENSSEKNIYLKNILKKFKLMALRNHHPYVLSGGEMRRLALAIAFINIKADLFLLDEPTANIDQKNLMFLKSTLRDMKNQGKGIMIVSHDIEFQFSICDRIAILVDGYIQFIDTPFKLMNELNKSKWRFFELPQIYSFIQLLENKFSSENLLWNYLKQSTLDKKIRLIAGVLEND
ncbi:MAG: ABC transporter ATP-binding protein [Candidatus Hodarchaeota archaeon]